MIINIILFGVLAWSGYKAFTAETKSDALGIIFLVFIPTILYMCGARYDADTDWPMT